MANNWYKNGMVAVNGTEFQIWRRLDVNSWFVEEAAYGQINADVEGCKDLADAIQRGVNAYNVFNFAGPENDISISQARQALSAVRA